MVAHSLVHSHPLAYSLTHSLTCSLARSLTHSLLPDFSYNSWRHSGTFIFTCNALISFKNVQVVYFFSFYADICLRRANTLIENEKSARYSLAGLQKSFEEIQSREAQRRKELTGGGKRLSAIERKHEEEQRTRYAKTVATFEQDISNAEQDAHDAAQELRWLRRRSAIARAAAQRLRISSKHKEEKSILQDLLSTFANSSLAPQTRWTIAQVCSGTFPQSAISLATRLLNPPPFLFTIIDVSHDPLNCKR